MALSCCSQLASIPGLSVAYPNSTSYIATEKAYWSLQEGSLTPSCIAKPTTSSDVADIVSSIVAHGECQLAIKSHGHGPAPGFANIDNGVTIDLASLNSITVNEDHSIASVGAGASWLEAYTFLDPLNKTVAGGRNGRVGVGGLTLGGGISYLGPQVGWSCDTVQNFEIVLASGGLVNANATSHPDLFRALKGGTNNFGVVTRFDFATLPIGEILGGSNGNDISYRQDVFRAFANIANAPEYDVHASVVMGMVFNTTSKAWSLSSTPIYTKPDRYPPVYQELFTVPNISDTMHLTRLSTFADEAAIPQLNALFYTGTYKPSSELLACIFDITNSSLYPLSDSILWNFAFEPLPTVFVSHGAGENILGTSAADGNGMILLVSAFWTDTSVSSHAHSVVAELMGRINNAAEKAESLHKFVYANYAEASQDPFESYGSSNEHFLRKVAKRYDPSGVFQRLVPGGFKLKSQ